VKEMAKFLSLWRYNPNAPWPIDPTEMAKIWKMFFAELDDKFKDT
jgi:hypothetical protein